MDEAFELELLRNETLQRDELVHDDLARLDRAIATTYTLLMAIVLMLMQAGFAMLEAGSVRERGVRDVLFKNMLDFSIGAVAWYLLGYLFYSDSGNCFIGMPTGLKLANGSSTPFAAIQEAHTMLHGQDVSQYQMSFIFAVTCATIVSGAIAERTQQRAYIFSSSAMVGLVYPVVAHWVWSSRGWLSFGGKSAVLGGAFDFAGGGVVHVTGGVMALVAAAAVGPRAGRFEHSAAGQGKLPGNSAVLITLGTLLLWIGWMGFNCGSVGDVTRAGAATLAAQVAVRTTLAGSAGSLAATTLARCRNRVGPMGQWGVWSLEHACNGLLGGLVSITAGAPVVNEWTALIVGAIGGLVYFSASHVVSELLRIDDVVDAFAVHGACGMWSLLAVGLLADGSLPVPAGDTITNVDSSAPVDDEPAAVVLVRGAFAGGGGSLFAAELVAALCISAWALALAVFIFGLAKRLKVLRISAEYEITGIDIAELGSPAYAMREHDLSQPQGAVALPIEDASEAAAASQAGEPGSVELQPQIAEGRLVVSDGTSMIATGAGAPSDDGVDAAGTEPAVEIPEGQAIYGPQREFVQSMMSPQV